MKILAIATAAVLAFSSASYAGGFGGGHFGGGFHGGEHFGGGYHEGFRENFGYRPYYVGPRFRGYISPYEACDPLRRVQGLCSYYDGY